MPEPLDPNSEKIAELTGRVAMLEGYVLLLTSALIRHTPDAKDVLVHLNTTMDVATDELRAIDPELRQAETIYSLSHWTHLRQMLRMLMPEHGDVLSN